MTTNLFRPFACVFVASALTGCSALPTVSYVKVDASSKSDNLTDSFYLATSEIVIDKLSETKDKVKTETQFAVTSRPIEFRSYKVGVRAADSFGVSTKVNIVKKENTDLVSSIGIETTDDRKNLIEQIGGVVVKVVTLAAALAPEPGKVDTSCIRDNALPVVIALSPADLASTKELKFGVDGKSSASGCISVVLDPLSPDAVANIPWDSTTHNYYYSACRNAHVTVKIGNGQDFKSTVRIADPNAVQFVQFPYKGSVTSHSQCGVSVKTDSTGSSVSNLDLISALAVQGKAIKDAIDSAKK